MGILEAIILGLVQGLTEFLPVSSSGHLQIAKEMLGVTLSDNLTFDIMLHLATVLATVVVLWREVKRLVVNGLKILPAGRTSEGSVYKLNPDTMYLLKLLLSAVPVAIVGLLLRDELNRMLASPSVLLIVGAMLMVTAVLLTFANYAKERQKSEISWRDAFIIGLAQAVAVLPGLSRSGTTIATGLLLGNKKAAVAQFSFLMVIIPILGETLLDVIRGFDVVRPTGGVFGLSVSGMGVLPYVAGFAAAFAMGCVACKFMIEMVKRSKLVWFAVYCAVAGAGAIIWYLV